MLSESFIEFTIFVALALSVFLLWTCVGGPLVAASVRALLRPLASARVDTVTLKEVQWWHQHCRNRAAELKDKRRAAEKNAKGSRWTPHMELLLACYERLANETAELAELMQRPTGEATGPAVS